jgi:hypothetical protein
MGKLAYLFGFSTIDARIFVPCLPLDKLEKEMIKLKELQLTFGSLKQLV